MSTTARDPKAVPEAISVKLGDMRFTLAEEANAKGLSLGELIRRRLEMSLRDHPFTESEKARIADLRQ